MFPFTRPPLDIDNESTQTSTASLRSAKPTWARARSNVSTENRQRVIVFVAGGATYSESRACYSVGHQTNREIFLVTSHMLTPALFTRQVSDLSRDKRRLAIPAEQPKPQAPAHLFEPDEKPRAAPAPPNTAPRPPEPPVLAMANTSLNGRPNGSRSQTPDVPPQANTSAKLTKDAGKKKHRFGFGRKD